uniref:microfibril-associated glycoprotein 4-like n=1 Tax=Styela clava TaxID=7725 RepID=UPI00193A89DB|nr:microfibril-associated glycoprotein 4-like [Styela clava]
MYFLKFLILFGLLGVAYCQDPGSVYGFCSQIYAMNRFCMNQITGSQAFGQSDDAMQQPRIGKAGPKGEKGSTGDPGTVNYTAIEESIEKKIEETENRINVKLERLERLLEEEKMENEERCDEIKNVTDEITKERQRRMSGCEKVSQDDAKLWDGRGGVFDIYRNNNKYEVYCDLTTDGGKWTVFQRRVDGTESFDRGWEEYAEGFGRETGEFWLGLETIHQLTKDGTYELRVDLSDWNNNVAYAKYSTFKISGREDNYRLTVSGYSGTAGDALNGHNNMQFSAPDKDLDTWGDHCANYLRGGWWFFACENSHLNGEYLRTMRSTKAAGAGIMWYRWRSGQTMKTSVMMLRKT